MDPKTAAQHNREVGATVADCSFPAEVERSAATARPSPDFTITLTGRAPVRVVKADWPIVARAKHWDNEHEFQANRTWKLIVRAHEDGRAIVYGIYTTQFQGERDRRGGELVSGGEDVAAAIRRVGELLDFGDEIIQECIADLPAETI